MTWKRPRSWGWWTGVVSALAMAWGAYGQPGAVSNGREALLEQQAAFESQTKPLNRNDAAAYAAVLRALGDFDLEVDLWRGVTARQPDDAEAWVALGRAGFSAGPAYSDEAFDAFRRAVALAPAAGTLADAHNGLGYAYYRAGLYPLAAEAFDAALAADAKHVKSLLGRTALQVRNGEVVAAAQTLDALAPDAVDAAAARDFQQVLELALRDFTERRLWFNDTAENHFAYARLLLRANRLPESVGPLERTVKREPGNYQAWNMLGSVYVQLGELEPAIAAFERSLAINPAQPRTQERLDNLRRSHQQADPAPGP